MNDSLQDAEKCSANIRKTCLSEQNYACNDSQPNWLWWRPISDLVSCPIQVTGLMCVGNKECREIMLENTPNLKSQFPPKLCEIIYCLILPKLNIFFGQMPLFKRFTQMCI